MRGPMILSSLVFASLAAWVGFSVRSAPESADDDLARLEARVASTFALADDPLDGFDSMVGEPGVALEAAPPSDTDSELAVEPADTDHHVVRPGETLASIASWRYGDRSRATFIYRANRDQIEDPDRIYPGQRLALP